MGVSVLGTNYYQAPELLTQQFGNLEEKVGEDFSYDSTVDLWAIGFVFYEMLFGEKLIATYNPHEFLKIALNQTGDNLIFPIDKQRISEDSKDLLRKLTQPDPFTRGTKMPWDDIINHQLFKVFTDVGENKEAEWTDEKDMPYIVNNEKLE